MPKQPNRKRIGIFLFIGIVSFLIVFGYTFQNKLFHNKGAEVVMYFDESIKGLNVGSPVVLKGVKVGEVTKIRVNADIKNLTFSIPVYARMQTKEIHGTEEGITGRTVLRALIDKGLRARLTSQSFVTGQLMIELEMLPDVPVKYRGDRKVPEIPTAMSPMGKLSRGLQELPLQEGMRSFAQFFHTLNKDAPEISKDFAVVAKASTRNLNTLSEVLNNFNKTLQSINKAAKSMQYLTDYLERHPESLL
ncbi:MAG: MlaD family protein, partial [Alphaproteobacteria bacterium]|nr:MlaD family protein [Alphaproteobacteria bacterium]